MPKKKRQSRGHAAKDRARRSQENAARRREELLKGFSRWAPLQAESAPAEAMVDDLRLLLELKTDQLDSPDPTLWTAETTEKLLTEVLPRKVLRDRSDAMLFVPALGRFFDYLVDAGKWHQRSMPPHAAEQFLSELEFDVVEAMDDPTRRSFGGNIMTYAVENGIELSDEETMNRYMAWYNALPQAERTELSDTGRLAAPSTLFDPSVPAEAYPQPDLGAAPDLPDDRDDAERDDAAFGEPELDAGPGRDWPWFLGAPPESDAASRTPFDPAQVKAEYESNHFARRARVLLDLVAGGRKVTGTEALTLADTREVLSRCGIETPPFRTMWDVPEVAGPWIALIDGRWIRIEGTRAVLGEGMVPAASPAFDPDGYAQFVHALLSLMLTSHARSEPGEGGFVGMPDTVTALLQAARPAGLTLPAVSLSAAPETDEVAVPVDPHTGRRDLDEVMRLWHVETDLVTLVAYGAIERDGARFRAPSIVLQALGVMMDMMMELDGMGGADEMDD